MRVRASAPVRVRAPQARPWYPVERPMSQAWADSTSFLKAYSKALSHASPARSRVHFSANFPLIAPSTCAPSQGVCDSVTSFSRNAAFWCAPASAFLLEYNATPEATPTRPMYRTLTIRKIGQGDLTVDYTLRHDFIGDARNVRSAEESRIRTRFF